MSHARKHTKIILSGAGLLLGTAVWIWMQRPQESANIAEKHPSNPYAGLDLVDPEASYAVLRYVVETGGNERTREQAIAWLDQRAREQSPIRTDQENFLLTSIAANGHASWDPEYRFWIFNSAFNVLRMGSQQEAVTRLLQKLAREAPEKTMRLYALQHLALQRADGHLMGPLADEIRADIQSFASDSNCPVAGAALSNLLVWDGSESPADAELTSLALQRAADSSCSIDVRVASLHAARAQALELSRRLAVDTSQHVQLRKASISIIGDHGQAEDRPILESLRIESFRIAQAADPALRAINKRMIQHQAP